MGTIDYRFLSYSISLLWFSIQPIIILTTNLFGTFRKYSRWGECNNKKLEVSEQYYDAFYSCLTPLTQCTTQKGNVLGTLPFWNFFWQSLWRTEFHFTKPDCDGTTFKAKIFTEDSSSSKYKNIFHCQKHLWTKVLISNIPCCCCSGDT